MTITKHSVSIVAVAFSIVSMFAIAFAFAPKAQAADLGGSSYDYFVPDAGGSSYDYFVPDTGGYSYDYYVPEYGGGSSYDYYVPNSYGGGYSTGGGWSMPFSSLGGGGYGGGSSMSQSQSQSSTNVNSCTAGSCNTNINAPTNIVTTNPAPQTTVVYAQTPVYTTPVYIPTGPAQYDMCPNIAGVQPTLPTGYYVQNGNCFWYTTGSQPYVTLSAVPYTGYEMGPIGTALYWGFLVAWCLLAAYLIVVKKAHHSIAAYFSGRSERTAQVATVAHATHAPKVSVAPASAQFDGIDPFIASQIARNSK
jgi:hypothetical protein